MKRSFFKLSLAVAVGLASSPVLANGLAINEQNVSSAGSAYAGRSSNVLDASTIYGNPAGMSRLNSAQITVGAAFIDAKTDISNVTAPLGGTAKGDMVPKSTVPFLYYVNPLTDKVAVGLGFYVPYGVESEYDNSFAGRLYGLHSKVTVMTLQPTLSYKFSDRFSLGLGVTLNRIEGKLTNAIPDPVAAGMIQQTCAPSCPPPVLGLIGALAASPNSTPIEIEGDDKAAGYNAGLLFAVTDNIDWGITYHSKLHFGLEGHTTVSSAPAALGLNGRYDSSLAITMPESIDSSVTWHKKDWSLSVGATWTHWSRLSGITVKSPSAPAQLSTVKEELNWEDTVAFAIGGSYDINDSFTVRAGYANDPSPTDDADRTVRIPVSDRNIITIGLGWNVTDALTVDFAYGYLKEDKGEVTQTKGLGTKYSADYENSANTFGAQATWRF